MTDAGAIRSAMRARRAALSESRQAASAQAVQRHICALEAYRDARCVMAYVAARGELSLAAVMEDVLAQGKALVLPRCEHPGVMTARRIDRLSQLVRGAYGLMEPDAACEIAAPQEIGLVLVPGTAFDRAGGRIGQGGGYYDRFLTKTDALRVGVCHGFALLDALPQRAHDQRMDIIVTPEGAAVCDTQRNRRMHDEQGDC